MDNFTLQDVKNWIGSDATRDDLIDIIKDLANGIYRPAQLRQDIADYIQG
jgi:hypothetical protein